MRLGTQTGSLTNHILSRAVIGQPEPLIGMGCTILCWTDRHAATVIDVRGDMITVQEDHAKRSDNRGMCDTQDWTHEKNPNGHIYYFRKGKDERWSEVIRNPETKRWNKSEGHGLRMGERDHYYDFSF